MYLLSQCFSVLTRYYSYTNRFKYTINLLISDTKCKINLYSKIVYIYNKLNQK